MERTKETRAKIAAVALRLLEKRGEDAVTVRGVARAVGITPMAIYHHFPSREALLRAIADAEFDRIGALFDSWQDFGSPVRRLQRMTQSYIDYAFARPRLFAFVFGPSGAESRRFPRDFDGGRSPVLMRVADMVAAAMREGLLKKDSVWEVTLALWAFMHGHLALYGSGRLDYTEVEFRACFRRSWNRLLKGLKCQAQ